MVAIIILLAILFINIRIELENYGLEKLSRFYHIIRGQIIGSTLYRFYPDELFPEVTFENSPQEVELNLVK